MTAVSRHGDKSRALPLRCVLVGVGFALIGLMQIGGFAEPAHESAARSNDCVTWDRAASEAVAGLIFVNTSSGELRWDEAIRQLRRARRNCRIGSIALARHDYEALQRSFPVAASSINLSKP